MDDSTLVTLQPSSTGQVGAELAQPASASPGESSKSGSHPGARRESKGTGSASATRIRRRNRLITSCLECRRRKLKCDRTSPCSNCTRHGRDCLFIASTLNSGTQRRIAELKERVGCLERSLENDIARQVASDADLPLAGLPTAADEFSDADDLADADADDKSDTELAAGPDDEKDLDPTPLTLQDAAYEDSADDEFTDLGIRMGRIRITDRIGGFFRPKLGEELGLIGQSQPSTGFDAAGAGAGRSAYFEDQDSQFIPPSANFLFASRPWHESIIQYIPSKHAADTLLRQYWFACHPVARIIHRPTFERKYGRMWSAIAEAREPVNSFAALLLAALLSAVISLSDETVLRDYGVARSSLIEGMKAAAETALCKSKFLQTTKLETIQAFVLYLLPLCRGEVSRAHSALTGTAIRLAECMGLHRDGSFYGLSPVETHVRRMVWYQLCFLDYHTCDTTGPRLQIRQDDYDTHFPLNSDDTTFESQTAPRADSRQFTDMTTSLIRMRCTQMLRTIWVDRLRVEKKRTTITSVLRKIQDFRGQMEQTYIALLDRSRAEQLLAYHIYCLLTARVTVALLHRFHADATKTVPVRLRELLRSAGTSQLEHAMAIDTVPALRAWKWYSGAFQQYQIALLLLIDLMAQPDHPNADRIWNCLDFVFSPPPNLPTETKAKMIVQELGHRVQIYHSRRKTRAPTQTNQYWTDVTTGSAGAGASGADSGKRYSLVQQMIASQSQAQLAGTSTVLGARTRSALGTAAGPVYGQPESYATPSLVGTAGAGVAVYPADLATLSLPPTYSPHQLSKTHTSPATDTANVLGADARGDASLDIDWDEWNKIFPVESDPWTLDQTNLQFG